MSSKSVKNLILTLIILIIGVNLISYVSKTSMANYPLAGIESITGAVSGMANLLTIGIGILIIILIPVWLSSRSKEKKETNQIRQ